MAAAGYAGAAGAVQAADVAALRQDAVTAFGALLSAASAAELTPDTFRRGVEALGLDYFREAEVHRTFKRLRKDCNPSSSDFGISEGSFCDAVMSNELLRSLVVQINTISEAKSFKVPDGFDYGKPTSEAYASSSSEDFGSYTAEREGGKPPEKRDYGYHHHYTKERQAWQDLIVRCTVTRHAPQPRPWIVFTCGAMGCGKGYTFQKMSELGHFPIEDIVRIDPDNFKMLMPEWAGYLENGKDAGSMTHQESGFLQELCQEAALRRRQNTWVDGSLRNGAWFSEVFDDIKRRFPDYRIGIIYVHASEATVRSRVAERKKRTGRDVPEFLMASSIAAPKDTLFLLEPKCSWLARIDNEVTPTLTSFHTIESQPSWGAMARHWARVEPAPWEFPRGLAPLGLELVEGAVVDGPTGTEGKNGNIMKVKVLSVEGKMTDSCEVRVSALSVVGFSSETWKICRKTIGMCPAARWLAFAYPRGGDCLRRGGFIFFDEMKQPINVWHVAGHTSSCPHAHFMEFDAAERRDASHFKQQIENGDRWSDVNVPDLLRGGARRYTWVTPGEIPESGSLGAFLYELDASASPEGQFVLFPVRAPHSS